MAHCNCPEQEQVISTTSTTYTNTIANRINFDGRGRVVDAILHAMRATSSERNANNALNVIEHVQLDSRTFLWMVRVFRNFKRRRISTATGPRRAA
eukprot:2139510-Heterocapsa_arctica.AAC.1